MKGNSALTCIIVVILFSCNQKKNNDAAIQTVTPKKVIGTVNTDSNASPIVTMLTADNAPKAIPAGKPVVIQNPNADGLGDPSFTIYGTEQGLALENTTCALVDKMGNLWFASNGGGVSKYDGTKFTVYSAANGLDNGIYHMAQDTTGNIWFDIGDGVVYKYDGTKMMNYSIDGVTGVGIGCMYGDKEGNTWFGTGQGAVKYELPKGAQPEKISRYNSKQGLIDNSVNSIIEDKSGNIWMATNNGVSKFDGTHFINYTKDSGMINNVVNIVEEDTSGNIWIGTDSGVSKFDGSRFTNYSMEQGLGNNAIYHIKADAEGTIWFGTGSGISKYEIPGNGKTGVFTNYTKVNGLPDNNITNITEDQTGSIWIGTERGGVCKYNRNSLTKYTTSLGLAGNVVTSIIQDKADNFWFGTEGGGISKYDGKGFTNYTQDQGLSSNNVYSMLQDRAGNIWIGSDRSVSKFDGKYFTNYYPAQGIPKSIIWNMLEDKMGNLWLSSFRGVSKFNGKSFTRYTTAQGLVSDEMLSIIQDNRNNIWFSANGVSKFDGIHFTNYTTRNGLPLDEIPGLMQDAKGNIWFGFYGKGVSKFNDNYLTTYTTTQGVADNAIFKMREDKVNHRIWFATNSGLSMMKLTASEAGNKDSNLFENFNYKTGYDIKDFSFNFSLYIDSKGVIWGGAGDRKLIRFDYNHLNRSNKPFRLQLQNVAINNENICWNLLSKNRQGNNIPDSLALLNEMTTTFGKVLSGQELRNMVKKYNILEFDSISPFYPVPQNLVLPYKMNNISFEFAAIEPTAGSRVKYQYLLEGYDKEWSPLTNKTSTGFGNIREGTYTFRLKALNPFGIWSETSYQFKVLPPVYRTWWAYVMYTLLFLGALRIFSKWRERNLRNEKEKLEQKVEERTNELKGTLENLKSTQAQLIQSEKMASLGELTAGIAHEIQNPLNFVNNFSEVNSELIEELKGEKSKEKSERDEQLEEDLLNDIAENEKKINHHGKRADAIVKGMLQHSQSSSRTKEPTDINALADEYLRLAYHGSQAKDKSFNAILKTDYDVSIGNIDIIPQDIGRVLLNLYNNAFYAVMEKKKLLGENYMPVVTVSTCLNPFSGGRGAEIKVADNGNGIPPKIVDKIFQPFFTTKPTGQGTGLGLSLSYDIIKAHGGELKVETKEGEGSEFITSLPIV